ncbi:MAG TPA: RNA-splicing ligase RtcB, partial [Cytophagales bacterium]|nr:RNA-splicing ligase RtcB [Cytophagales bacterium]
MEITGKTLIEWGYKPGKWFKGAIEHANQHQLAGDALRQYLDAVQPTIIDPHAEAAPFYRNIRAETPDEEANVQQVLATMDELMKTPTLTGGAVMPDACPTGPVGQIPVGGVVAAQGAIHPAMHSADICCSVMMTSLGKVDPRQVLDAAQSVTHFGGGGRKALFDLPAEFLDKIRGDYFLGDERSLTLARTHYGTQGDGNHFLYVGRSRNTGETVVVTHHGSRGFGANLFRKGMKVAEGFRKEFSPQTKPTNAWIPYAEDIGKQYWQALQWVREWTKLNHQVIHDQTLAAV